MEPNKNNRFLLPTEINVIDHIELILKSKILNIFF